MKHVDAPRSKWPDDGIACVWSTPTIGTGSCVQNVYSKHTCKHLQSNKLDRAVWMEIQYTQGGMNELVGPQLAIDYASTNWTREKGSCSLKIAIVLNGPQLIRYFKHTNHNIYNDWLIKGNKRQKSLTLGVQRSWDMLPVFYPLKERLWHSVGEGGWVFNNSFQRY